MAGHSYRVGDRVRVSTRPKDVFRIVHIDDVGNVVLDYVPSASCYLVASADELTLDLDWDLESPDEITAPITTKCYSCEEAESPMRNPEDSFKYWTYCKKCGRFIKRFESNKLSSGNG